MSKSILSVTVALTVFASSHVFAQGTADVDDAGRDRNFNQALALYEKRTDPVIHRKAWDAVVAHAKANSDDYPAQIWCARTSFHFAHRRVQSGAKDDCGKIALVGIECALQALRIRPKDYDGRYWELMNRHKAASTMNLVKAFKKAKKMRPALEALISQDKTRFEGYLFVAMAYRELPSVISWGDDEKALEYAKKAFALQPRDPEVLLEMGECHRENGNDDLARDFYERVQSSDIPKYLEWETGEARRWARRQLDRMN